MSPSTCLPRLTFLQESLTLQHEGGTFLHNVWNINPATVRNNPEDLNQREHCANL